MIRVKSVINLEATEHLVKNGNAKLAVTFNGSRHKWGDKSNFVEGAAQAIADSGRLTVTIQGETVAQEEGEADNQQEIASGIEEAGKELGDILEEEGGEIEVLIRIESGTPMGLLFLEPVIQDSNI